MPYRLLHDALRLLRREARATHDAALWTGGPDEQASAAAHLAEVDALLACAHDKERRCRACSPTTRDSC